MGDTNEPADMYRDMAEQINAAWREKGYAEDAFREIARAALDDPILYQMGQDDWMNEDWPTPRRVLYAPQDTDPKRMFQIEARLYTSECPVSIVDEMFVGASRMLIGVAIENRYTFEIADPHPSPRCRLGVLAQQSARWLLRDDPPLVSDDHHCIESIVALDPRAIRMVIRTPQQIAEPFRYFRPALAAVDPTTPIELKGTSTEEIVREVNEVSAVARRLDVVCRSRSHLTDPGLRLFLTLLGTQLERRFIVDLIAKRKGAHEWQLRVAAWVRELAALGVLRLVPELVRASFIDEWLRLGEEDAVSYLLDRVELGKNLGAGAGSTV